MVPDKESAHPNRVLLLTEEQGPGGVYTLLSLLQQGLIHHGWTVSSVNVRQTRLGWIKLLAQARQANVVVASNNFSPAYWAVFLGLLSDRPSVVWVHGPLAQVLKQQPVSWLKQHLINRTLQSAQLLVFASRTSQASLQQIVPAQRLRRQAVISNPAAQVISDDFEAPQSNMRLGFVGRLSKEKRPWLLLEMMRHLPANYHLTMVGDGPLMAGLQQQAEHLGLLGQCSESGHCKSSPRVQFLGSQEVTSQTYRSWQATLICSAYEGYPMAALESLAAGVPCLGTPLPALNEMLGPVAQFWVSPQDTALSLAQTVLQSLETPPEKRRQQAFDLAKKHSLSDFFRNWHDQLLRVTRQPHSGTKTVHFVHTGPAYMPEIAAYESHLNALGHHVMRHSTAATVPQDADIVWWICGRVSKHHSHRLRYSLHVHEYASASVGRWPALKDRIKRWLNPKPDFRIFLNEWVRNRMGFEDEVPSCLRDMGVPLEFLDARATLPVDQDLVYLGEMSRLRSFLPALSAISQAGLKLLLIGDVPNDLATQLNKLNGITCTGRINQQSLPTQLLRARAGLNLMPNRLPLIHQTSTKVLEYLAIGLPVLSNDYPWARDIKAQFKDRIHLLDSTNRPQDWHQAFRQLPVVQSKRSSCPDLKTLSWHDQLAQLSVWSSLGLTEAAPRVSSHIC